MSRTNQYCDNCVSPKIMKAVKVMASIDEKGQLTLDKPLNLNKNSRVEVIVLISEEAEDEDDTPKEIILEDFREA